MPRTILIVDDNKVNRMILSRMLRPDYDVAEAENGRQALDILKRDPGRIDAVLLDLIMPVLDGYQVLEAIRADPDTEAIPVIVTTGLAEEKAEDKALALGANDYILKPYNPAIIRHRLRSAIKLREISTIVTVIQRDKLTGLYNREAFFLKAEELIAAGQPGDYVMACFDIDHFKFINDQYGSARGDLVLRQLADIFRQGFEPNGGICGRIMADNFAALYPVGFMNSDALAEIRDRAAKLDGEIEPISYSIGRYLVTDLSLSVSAMYDRAAIAEESVKARFDARIAQYDESMRQTILREQEIVGAMDNALKTGQFEVWYQPQYNHSSGALIGAEALVRWRHPERGLIPPVDFIPVFEQNGFIYEMDKYVWEVVCARMRRWLDEGRQALPIAVNVSRYDIFREDFYQVITGLFEKYDVPLTQIRLEITESAFSKSGEQIIRVVKQLVDYGLIVEIDDFGSGYSSLNTLKDVPANILKLDMRFLQDADNSSRGGNIVESVVRMAKWLGMPVIAEGVETKAQADFLRSIGCFYVQGYLYGRPMPCEEYEKLAASGVKEAKMATLTTVKTLDNNAFWNPNSMDTLIFNSYVGGACIFEYVKGKTELLRANEKFAREIGGEQASMEDALALDLSKLLDDDNRRAFMDSVKKAITTDAETTCEVCARVPGAADNVYLRAALRMIARAGERVLLYCAVINLTAQRMGEKKIMESASQLRFLNDTAHELLSQPDPDVAIHTLLRRALDYFSGVRAYVFELDDLRLTSSNTYEICAPGVTSEMDILQNVPCEMNRFWYDALEKQNFIVIEDVEALADDREEERNVLLAQGIKALVAVPLRRDGRLIGYAGVDDPARHQSHIGQLQAIGDYIATILLRRDLNRKIASDHQSLEALMNDTPGGFVRMRVLDEKHIVPDYFNDGFCHMMRMTREEFLRMYGADAFAGVYPEDLPIVRAAVREMLDTGETRGVKYRLRHGSAGYAWVMISGRKTRGASGGVFLNIYYSDLSEKENKELAFRDMLPLALKAMMASANNLSFVKDKELKYICCSRVFAHMVGLRDESEIVGKTDAELFDKDMAEGYRADDLKLMAEGKSLVDYVERIPSKDGSSHYSSTSKYLLYDALGEVIGLYGMGRDITEEREALAQLQLLTNNIPGGIAMYEVTNAGARILYFSDGFYSLTGYTKDEYQAIAAKDSMALIFPEDIPSIRAELAELMNGKDSIEYTYRARCKEGGYRWLSLRGAVLERREGAAIVNAVKIDITERMKHDEKLRMSDEQYRLALENSGRIIARYDVADRSVNMTRGVANIFGMPEKVCDVPDAPVREGIISRDTAQAYTAFYEGILKGVKRGDAQFCSMSANGWRWLKASYTTIFSDEGAPVSAILVMEDITSERDATAATRENEQVMRLVAEHSDRIVFRYDIAAKTAYADERAAREHAVPREADNLPESLIARGDVLPESVDGFRRVFTEIHDGVKNGDAKLHLRDVHGVPHWVDIKYSVIFDEAGAPKSAVISFLNITESHEKELAYERYLQTIDQKAIAESVLLYLEADVTADMVEKKGGAAIPFDFPAEGSTRESVIEYIANTYIAEEERDRCRAFFSRSHIITAFSDGLRSLTDEWSVYFPGGQMGFVRSELQMVQDPYTGHIKLYTILRDITREKHEALKVRRMAETDGMTGLYNKATTESLVTARLKTGDPRACAMLIADLDNLKGINDSQGHACGDQAIKLIGDTLRAQFRKGDIVGRVGGDEFVVFLDNCGTEAWLNTTMLTMMKRMAMLRVGEQGCLPLRASIGIVMDTTGTAEYGDLFKRADRALYHVKRNGKNDFAFYRPEMELDAYQYKAHNETELWRESLFSKAELNRLLAAVSALYPLVISVNLTKNSYYMMQYENYTTRSCVSTGAFDELIEEGAATFCPDDQESFKQAFRRENLLRAYARGERVVTHKGRQRGDDGVYRVIQTDAIFVQSADSDDILEISLGRECVNEQVNGFLNGNP